MKICLLANPRSGSKSLMAFLQSIFWDLDYYSISEPFNIEHHNNMGSYTHDFFLRIKKENKVIIKSLVNQKPENYTDVNEWYIDMFKVFDKIILLDRRDKHAQCESYLYWKTKGIKEYGRWHVPSVYDLSNIHEDLFIETKKILEDQSAVLENISKSYGAPLFFYEDIFIEKNEETIKKIFKYIEMQPDEYNIKKYLFSNDLKVRQYKDTKTLI